MSLKYLTYHELVTCAAEIGEELLDPTNDMALIHALRREYQRIANEHAKRIGR